LDIYSEIPTGPDAYEYTTAVIGGSAEGPDTIRNI
jgi:hypothetical protein